MELGEGVAWGLGNLMSSPGTRNHGSETSSFSITWTYVRNAIPRRTASDSLGVGPRHVCCDSPPLGTGIQALVAGSG